MGFIFIVNILVYHIGLSEGLTEELLLGVLAMDISYLLFKGDVKYTYKFLGLLTGYAIVEHINTLEGVPYYVVMALVGILTSIII